MKIVEKIGNLMHVKIGHIVHGCNAQGVMGSGVALAVKQTYPLAYQHYIIQHNTVGLKLGKAYSVVVSSELIVWNAITQDNFGYGKRQVSYDAIQTCFEEVNSYIRGSGVEDRYANVHIPMIGAVRGGGNWNIIRTIIEETMDYPVTLWLPDSTVTTI